MMHALLIIGAALVAYCLAGLFVGLVWMMVAWWNQRLAVRQKFHEEYHAKLAQLQHRRQTSSGLYYYVAAPPDDLALYRDFLNARPPTRTHMN